MSCRPWHTLHAAVLCGLTLVSLESPAMAAANGGAAAVGPESPYVRVDADNVPIRPFPTSRPAPAGVRLAQAKGKKDDDLLLGGADDKKDGDSLLSDDDGKKDGDSLLSDDDGKKDDGDLLREDGKSDKPELAKEKSEEVPVSAAAEHEQLFTESRYPSATTCGTCHPRHFEEWSVSQHSYAQLSPVYMAFQNTINFAVNGTNGDFCIRCHNQVGMNQNESPQISNLERHPTSREGITCVVCHRVENIYNKASGRIALVEGDLLKPVYGPSGNAELKRVLENTQEFRVVTKADEAGRKIHTDAVRFEPISSSTFCGTCHDVTLFNGFRLEEAFSEYRDSPAAAKGVTCQDCHMGTVQGGMSRVMLKS